LGPSARQNLPPVVLDVTRLATRLNRATPNGIDRVDLAYARHFLEASIKADGALMGAGGGPRLVASEAAASIARLIALRWRDGEPLHAAPVPSPANEKRPAGIGQALIAAVVRDRAHWLGRRGVWPGQNFVRHAPQGAIYMNVSQFPIWRPSYFAWCRQRPDIRPIFFVHDLLPLDYPEFFRPFETRRHVGRMDAVMRHAAGIIVAAEATKTRLLRLFAHYGRRVPPILVAPLPVATGFMPRPTPSDVAPARPTFVSIGTLEPRKNQLFLLQIWRDMARRLGAATPRLVLVGQYGWDNENIRDMLERSPHLQGHVEVVQSMATSAMNDLLTTSVALLMPTFAEGFGLPVAEAVAAHVPVIASDIDVFREYGAQHVTRIPAHDGLAWMSAIEACATKERPSWVENPLARPHSALYFSTVCQFLAGVSAN
jgi:glycosyltransferase involved in cell wall biosynthesis